MPKAPRKRSFLDQQNKPRIIRFEDRHKEDVLGGKGAKVSNHNIETFWNHEIMRLKQEYLQIAFTGGNDDPKTKMAERIIDGVRRAGGEFYDKITGEGSESGVVFFELMKQERAIDKTMQKLRENGPTIRSELALQQQQQQLPFVDHQPGQHQISGDPGLHHHVLPVLDVAAYRYDQQTQLYSGVASAPVRLSAPSSLLSMNSFHQTRLSRSASFPSSSSSSNNQGYDGGNNGRFNLNSAQQPSTLLLHGNHHQLLTNGSSPIGFKQPVTEEEQEQQKRDSSFTNTDRSFSMENATIPHMGGHHSSQEDGSNNDPELSFVEELTESLDLLTRQAIDPSLLAAVSSTNQDYIAVHKAQLSKLLQSHKQQCQKTHALVGNFAQMNDALDYITKSTDRFRQRLETGILPRVETLDQEKKLLEEWYVEQDKAIEVLKVKNNDLEERCATQKEVIDALREKLADSSC